MVLAGPTTRAARAGVRLSVRRRESRRLADRTRQGSRPERCDSDQQWPGLDSNDPTVCRFRPENRVRMREGGQAGLFVRSWPTFDKTLNPSNGFRLTTSYTPAKNATTPADWSHWEVECNGASLRVKIDGELTYSFDNVNNPQGYIGLQRGQTFLYRRRHGREDSGDRAARGCRPGRRSGRRHSSYPVARSAIRDWIARRCPPRSSGSFVQQPATEAYSQSWSRSSSRLSSNESLGT